MFIRKKVRGQPQSIEVTTASVSATRAVGKIKICSWNVNGLQGILKKKFSDYPLYSSTAKTGVNVNCLDHFINMERPDILCLQEIRCSEKFQWRPQLAVVNSFDTNSGSSSCIGGSTGHTYAYHSDKRKGYSGTLVWSRFRPLSVRYGIDELQLSATSSSDSASASADEKKEVDGKLDTETGVAQEGRVITLEFETFYLINVYVPNSGSGRKRLTYRTQVWEPAFRAHVAKLQSLNALKAKPVVIVGDFNCIPTPIDSSYLPVSTGGMAEMAGSSLEEQICFRKLLAGENSDSCAASEARTVGAVGAVKTVDKLVDSFRALHPTKRKYSWGSGAPMRGCRLDFALCSAEKVEVVAADILDYPGSDHLPVTVTVSMLGDSRLPKCSSLSSSSSSKSAAEEFKDSGTFKIN